MKISSGLLSLTLATLVTGCTTKKYYNTTNTGGDCGGAPASVSEIQPSVAFAGRTVDVQIVGSNTSWDAATTVDFGSDITVNKVTLSSASGLVANITVPDTATTGPRDVTVKASSDVEAYKMTFTVQAPLTVTVQGTQQQGSILVVDVVNNDPIQHPFDTTTDESGNLTNLVLNLPMGYQSGYVQSATGGELLAIVPVDVKAPLGTLDIDVFSGPNASTATTCDTAGCFEYTVPKAANIVAQTPAVLTNETMVTLANPYDSKMYTYTPAAANHLVALATADAKSSSTLIVLDSMGEFSRLVAQGPTVNYEPTTTSPIYILVWDDAGKSSTNATVSLTDVALNVQPNGEGTDDAHQNDTIAGAVALTTPPVVVRDAQFLSDADPTTTSDLDTYKIVITGAGHSIHAFTSPGDTGAATYLQFLDATGTPIADASGSTTPQQDANDLFSDDTTGTLAAGTYYVQVQFGAGFFGPAYDVSVSHYNLTVVVN